MRRIDNFKLNSSEGTLLSKVKLNEVTKYSARDRVYETLPRQLWGFRSIIILDLRDLHEYSTEYFQTN